MAGLQSARTRVRLNRTVAACLALVLACAALAPAGCRKRGPDPGQARAAGNGAAANGVPVRAATVAQKAMPVEVPVVGNVQPYATVSIKSQVNGQVMRAAVADGQEVKKGDVLFELDKRPFQAAVDQAASNLARDTVQMKNAEAVAARNQALLAKGFLSQEEYDASRASADSFAAAVKADRAAQEAAQVQFDYCTIASPMDARAGAVLVNEGNLVKANDVPMVVLNQVRPVYVGFGVPEQYLPEIRKRMSEGKLEVRATVPAEPERPEKGVLTFVDNTVDSTTGKIQLRGTFPNTEGRLWPGLFVNVLLQLAEQTDAIVVPAQAVQVGQKGTYVFVVTPDMTVEMRPVTVDRELAGQSVIAKGLTKGEIVVTDGQLRLVHGTKVGIRTEGQPEQAEAPQSGLQPDPTTASAPAQAAPARAAAQ